MLSEHYYAARTQAGRAAVKIAGETSQEISTDMILGAFAGFLLAAAETSGWDATLHHLHQLARASRVPAECENPKLTIIPGGRAA